MPLYSGINQRDTVFKWINSHLRSQERPAPRWFFFEIVDATGSRSYHALESHAYGTALQKVQQSFPKMESCRPLSREVYHQRKKQQEDTRRARAKREPDMTAPRHLNKRDPQELAHAQALGLSGRVTLTEIQGKYKQLLAQYHPDKVSHLGPELREVADKRTREIMEAWQFFREKYSERD